MANPSKSQLEKLIRQVAKEDTSRVVFTRHAEKRMRERRISKVMALYSGPQFPDRYLRW